MIFDNAGGPWTAMALWLVGGALAWCGAVCYAELATTYPRDGGDYEYLNRAFGSLVRLPVRLGADHDHHQRQHRDHGVRVCRLRRAHVAGDEGARSSG